RGGHAALIYLNERGGGAVYTYAQLLYDVKRVAAALRALGVRKGDRITIYMPVSIGAGGAARAPGRAGPGPARGGGGGSAGAPRERSAASGSKAVFTADVTYRKGKDVPLTPIVDEALKIGGKSVEHVVVWKRNDPASWSSFISRGDGQPDDVEKMEANEPAYILATSGTTAKPKLAIHTHGGYQVHIVSMGKWCFGMTPDDVWWATSDIGWIVGHSYMIYAPLVIGCTSVVFEGALDHPSPEANWRAVVEEFGATGIFTSPTAVRMLMRYGDEPLLRVDHSRLRRVVCAGEVLNAPAWDWLQNRILKGRAPVIDNMWQTETGGPAFGNPYGIDLLPIKPGSATIPLPGIEAAVVTMEGERCAAGEPGIMTIRRPFPGLTPALWGEPDRYGRDYWQKIPGVYYSGDSSRVDEDGYVWFSGRADEIIKIAGHRIGTIEVESAFLKHASVA